MGHGCLFGQRSMGWDFLVPEEALPEVLSSTSWELALARPKVSEANSSVVEPLGR